MVGLLNKLQVSALLVLAVGWGGAAPSVYWGRYVCQEQEARTEQCALEQWKRVIMKCDI
jgi:hypothetical protein